jgi:CRP-like cAMP-binding protein
VESADSSKSEGRYKEGQYIISEGSPVLGMYFICEGKVKIVAEGLNNREQIVRLATKGHILGHRGYGDRTYPIGAVALEHTTVCFIDNDAFLDLLNSNPEFLYGLMLFYSRELRNAERRNKYLSQMNIREKIAESLLYYIKTFGFDETTGLINLSLPRKEISDLAGTNTDQVSRTLSGFKEEGIIDTCGRRVYLHDHKKLKEVVHEFDIPL